MKNEITLAIVVALLAFIGGAVGSFISSSIDEKKWEKQMKYDQNLATVQQRIKLIEKTSDIFGQLPRMTVLSKIVKLKSDSTKKLLELCASDFKEHGTAETCSIIKDSPEHVAMFTEVVNLRAKLNTILAMNILYFCSDTKTQILEAAKASKESISEEYRARILGAMVSETTCGLMEL
ncbi:MAG: hypothetical protein JAZ15_11795 [Candidatus Thiodiazotropha endolucinida]|nr:hypothetical protein [Candidatus Thiodiazotropha taylori]MCW4313704.1 hypothetical protein [Candidatus Thiodiazotropha taylori]